MCRQNTVTAFYTISIFKLIWIKLSPDGKVLVVVLPDTFRGMGAQRNSTEAQQSVHAPRSGPVYKNGRSSAKDGSMERLRYGTILKEVS